MEYKVTSGVFTYISGGLKTIITGEDAAVGLNKSLIMPDAMIKALEESKDEEK